MGLKENLERVLNRMKNAALRANRDPFEVRLVVASKYASVQQMEELVFLGIREFGENRAQDLVKKSEYFKGKPIIWHFIGRIQTNKVKYIVPRCELIHSVWREEELKEIEKRAEKLGKIQKILLEVNVFKEETKAGLLVEEVEEFLKLCQEFPHVEVLGFMTMAPYAENPEEVRWGFRTLRELRDELASRFNGNVKLKELSMGMSNDFEVAIEEGATMVRIGSAIFEGGK
ncbi:MULTISPECIES: YggS family pyridoxal phosphate-dependent enzyme [Thermotoga]|jgi:pyridoxal phosphate enzyme (YggS family)|uniref:Pyridoxal phosphate homeostasis protein n=3 Tax=Thermotoga petrophila TaxID=93929 RepID=A5ILH1_THEP1|nr:MULTISPECIES: YggS family pyridoxal phosphate-dependent enzyme [Thermotoga]KUK22934.1 MAG: Alanine racemase domain protein [Thermotoga petrophila]KUK33486.1 MAG: Alanine racemase domain protein [Thermotoga sp. 47_83]MBZ4661546.1 alanine racemase domain protein [Thermotoga sp.]ABQ47044.1 alanine racemase domain protein [Thermotoga petrophila RKU-1]ACB09440.1 alanine racemase domain protein [Thermotoga sp. RQ2]